MADGDTAFSEQVFDEWSGTPAMTEVEAIVEPNGVTNDVRRESVAFVSTHGPIPAISAC